MMETSFQAPSHWRMDQTEAFIRKFVLKHAPDVVLFQELPGLIPYVETHDLLPADTRSHCGIIGTLAKLALVDETKSYVIGRFAVCTQIEKLDLTIANVHLEPGKNGAYKRLEMMREISNRCETKGLAIVGDTNTRVEEEESFEKIGLLGKRPPTVTWDSRINEFREDGRKYSSYYTRFFHNEHIDIQNVKVWNQPFAVEDNAFFMSDHFAMTGEIVGVGDRNEELEVGNPESE